jgi:predicted Zn-dependent peptidase
MDYQHFQLSNGIRLVHFPLAGPVAHLGLFINVGTRDEYNEESGMAHFIEHAVFKGTRKRKAFHILHRLEGVGGDMNAYTTKEDICLHASFLSGHFERAAELFADLLCNPTFPEKELLKEKDVILEEIKSVRDTPYEEIYDDFEGILFNGHPLGNRILGTPRTVKSFTREKVLAFIGRTYASDQIVLATAGNIDFRKIIRIIGHYFAGYVKQREGYSRMPVEGCVRMDKDVYRKSYQSHCVTGSRAYPVNHPLVPALSVVNNHLGGPNMSSRLNLMVRERHGLSYTIESNFHPYSDTGVFAIYLGTDNSTLDKALDLVNRELKALRETRLSITRLRAIKLQYAGQVAIASESGINRILAMGKSMLMKGTVESMDEIFRKIESVSADEVLEVANQVFDPAGFFTVRYLSK